MGPGLSGGALPAHTRLWPNGFRKTSTLLFNDAEDCSCRILTFQKAGYKTAALSYFCKKVILGPVQKDWKETH